MGPLWFRRRYELLALTLLIAFSIVHVQTNAPILGASHGAGPLHRLVQNLEGRASTLHFLTRGERPADPRVVIVELDERGAQRFGLWPWPREVLAKVIDALLDAGVKVIGLDVTFADRAEDPVRRQRLLAAVRAAPETDETRALLAELETDPDAALAAAMQRAGPKLVQGLIPWETEATSADERARSAGVIEGELVREAAGSVRGSTRPFELEGLRAETIGGVLAPLPAFSAAGTHYGHFSTSADLDGTIRRSASLLKLEQPPGLFPSLGLRVAASMLGAQIQAQVDGQALTGAALVGADRTVVVPMEANNPYTLINYPGSRAAFVHLSVVDLLDGRVDPLLLANSAALVGVTLVGSSGDQRVTPFREFEAGVVTHAALVSNVLRGDFLDRPDWAVPLELGALLGLGLLVAVFIPRTRSFAAKIAVVVLVIALWLAGSLVAFTQGVLLASVVPVSALASVSFATIFLGYLSVDREKLKMRQTFRRYLGEDVMDVALENPERLNRGEKREMTVLFSDIRGFTSIAEHMPPEQLATFINQYLSPMTHLVFDEKGTLDKYIGDAVMAFWNAPLDQPDHALRACRAAVRMLEGLEVLKAKWRAEGYPELEIGVGLNTGPMVVGNLGSDVRVDYTVLGDAVNLGSRLEGTNKLYGTRIIISESTRAAAGQGLVTRQLGAVRVKGKRQPVAIFELRGLGTPSAGDAEAIARFEAGLAAWNAQRFDEAKAHFEAVLSRWAYDAPSRLYLAELEGLIGRPPSTDWDGVISLRSK